MVINYLIFIIILLINLININNCWQLNKPFKGDFTYYDNSGFGACGSQINAANEMLVAISHTEWNSAAFPNPNNDPLCKNICLKVAYKGKSVKLRVKDKCPGCTKTHADLSKPAFEKLAPLSVGHVYGATLTFVKC